MPATSELHQNDSSSSHRLPLDQRTCVLPLHDSFELGCGLVTISTMTSESPVATVLAPVVHLAMNLTDLTLTGLGRRRLVRWGAGFGGSGALGLLLVVGGLLFLFA